MPDVARPVVEGDAATAAYWEAAERGVLTIERCEACGASSSPPVGACRACRSTDLAAVPAPATGDVISWIVVHHSVLPHLVPDVPYAVALVELADGGRVLARWRGPLEALRPGPVGLSMGRLHGIPTPMADAIGSSA